MKRLQKRWGTKKLSLVACISMLLIVACATVVLGADEAKFVPNLYSTAWALVPPVVAIVLALITKEVYSSLFIGILVGAVLYGQLDVERTIMHTFHDGEYGFVGVLSDSYNVGILVFLVILGTIVALMNKEEDQQHLVNGPANILSQERERSWQQFCSAY